MGLSALACRLLKDLLQRIRASQLSCIWLRSEGGYRALPAVPNSCLPAAAVPAAARVAGLILLWVGLLGMGLLVALLTVLLLVMIGFVMMGFVVLLGAAALVLASLLLRSRSTSWGSIPASLVEVEKQQKWSRLLCQICQTVSPWQMAHAA